MKRNFIALSLFFIALFTVLAIQPATAHATADPIPINESTFPDAQFRTYVTTHIAEGVELTEEKANTTTEINLSAAGITNVATLQGIEYFSHLTTLNCSNNLNLTALDLSANSALEKLVCAGDSGLTTLDLSKNGALTSLRCAGTNITSLDVSKNPALTYLECFRLPLASLDLSNNPRLEVLYCNDTDITSLDVSKNHALRQLFCDNTKITTLDLLSNPELAILYCSFDYDLTALDLSANTKLTSLYCSLTDISELDLSNNPELTYIECHYTNLSHLDLRANTKLTGLFCPGLPLTSLDLSHNTLLQNIDVSECMLTEPLTSSLTQPIGIYSSFAYQNRTISLSHDKNGGYFSEETFSLKNPSFENAAVSFDAEHGRIILSSFIPSSSFESAAGFISSEGVQNLSGTLTFVVPQYHVTFLDSDGSVLVTQTVESGLGAIAPDAPAREGCTFTGWDTAFSTVTKDITVTALHEVNSYTVVFKDYDGATLKTQQVTYGQAATAPDNPLREGYIFTGWDIDTSKITADTVVTALYKKE